MDKGVRSKVIDFKPEHWDMVELPESMRQKVLDYFAATRGQRYSWLDLIRSQIFNRNANEGEAAFCSEWCAAALGLPNPTTYSPRTLGDLVRWHFVLQAAT